MITEQDIRTMEHVARMSALYKESWVSYVRELTNYDKQPDEIATILGITKATVLDVIKDNNYMDEQTKLITKLENTVNNLTWEKRAKAALRRGTTQVDVAKNAGKSLRTVQRLASRLKKANKTKNHIDW